jgi:hypothetical protein
MKTRLNPEELKPWRELVRRDKETIGSAPKKYRLIVALALECANKCKRLGHPDNCAPLCTLYNGDDYIEGCLDCPGTKFGVATFSDCEQYLNYKNLEKLYIEEYNRLFGKQK